jgi:hypothetical protein
MASCCCCHLLCWRRPRRLVGAGGAQGGHAEAHLAQVEAAQAVQHPHLAHEPRYEQLELLHLAQVAAALAVQHPHFAHEPRHEPLELLHLLLEYADDAHHSFFFFLFIFFTWAEQVVVRGGLHRSISLLL